MDSTLSRRRFLSTSGASLAAFALSGCRASTSPLWNGDGRITITPRAASQSLAPGAYPIGIGGQRDGQLYLPSGYQASTAVPLVLLLHGAGGNGDAIADGFHPIADTAGVALLAPDSRYRTWDIVLEGFGPDVEFIQGALNGVFDRVAIDPARIAIAGFSDGASYALSLGLTNGDGFRKIAAFSPGFLLPGAPHGKPPVFISHGTADTVLPIDTTSRRIRQSLEQSGYTVDFHEFDGGHAIPASLAQAAFDWIAAG